jgi:hypothetical protein
MVMDAIRTVLAIIGYGTAAGVGVSLIISRLRHLWLHNPAEVRLRATMEGEEVVSTIGDVLVLLVGLALLFQGLMVVYWVLS